ncbi:MAG: bifunctional class I SAM-dependent methyltransferase/glycosyltransferase family 2 protein [Anaerolineaceae bacterium]|nr:bifunctional class I SAM-dependent methyltransferase/glycosyltransferase family 2 protein [Anaerolineaceae bacterium]
MHNKSDLRDEAYLRYQRERISHWDGVAQKLGTWKSWGGLYHRRLSKIYRFLVTPGQRVLEIGCGSGRLLNDLKPSVGVGVDFSSKMIDIARKKHPDLCFIQADVHELELDEQFDVIILSDAVNDFWDVQLVFEKLKPLCTPSTRILLNYYSRLWELPLKAARSLGLATKTLYQNWLTVEDVNNLMNLEDFEVFRNWEEVLFPFSVPLIAPLFNCFLVKLWPFKYLALTNFSTARPAPVLRTEPDPLVSVIVPARNEAGNIPAIFARVPEMGKGTELVFVEGGSSDNTYETIEEVMRQNPQRKSILLRQEGKGKGDAVRMGFAHAEGGVLMILDADLTVPPEDLARFYDALVSGKGEMINGVRLVYPMEKQAMRFLNLLGNKFFSMIFSWLLGQPIKDTLCGTKVLWKKDYEDIAANRAYFGDFDPFGDFDLIFGAAKLNYRIIDIPVRYRERTYGDTNIDRWRHGLLLLRMVLFAARRLKFI